jgi:hypothetical protein
MVSVHGHTYNALCEAALAARSYADSVVPCPITTYSLRWPTRKILTPNKVPQSTLDDLRKIYDRSFFAFR